MSMLKNGVFINYSQQELDRLERARQRVGGYDQLIELERKRRESLRERANADTSR